MKSVVCCVMLLFIGGIVECAAKRRNHNDPPTDKLPITLYYESLCPYCRAFVTEQLNPSMVRQDRLAFTELTLVPYGNARKDNTTGKVTCQHGVLECELNAWHGCILEHHNITDALKLIACMMRSGKNQIDKCATRYSIDVTAVKACIKSRSVDDILEKYRKETQKIVHLYSGVPAIAVDNVYNQADQNDLTDNFDDFFCAKYEAKFNKKLKNCL
ncbi:GILT-like protein 2 [Drosophila albomicans]|uniref:GILT-like protein 2 n=1 Tax=Drosophila albomicans TaxID=7291 RepID=A0A6P8XKW0_DROAB|nr:GILT-like protein 2 [Drosophila albomicans]